MKSILNANSYRTGQNIKKFYDFSEPVFCSEIPEKFETLELHYNVDEKSCTVSPLNFTDPVKDEPSTFVVYNYDSETQNPLSAATDKHMIKLFLGRSDHKKLQIESDSNIFEDY